MVASKSVSSKRAVKLCNLFVSFQLYFGELFVFMRWINPQHMCVDAKRFCNKNRRRSTHGNATGHKVLMHEQFQNFTLVYDGVAYDLYSLVRKINVGCQIHNQSGRWIADTGRRLLCFHTNLANTERVLCDGCSLHSDLFSNACVRRWGWKRLGAIEWHVGFKRIVRKALYVK